MTVGLYFILHTSYFLPSYSQLPNTQPTATPPLPLNMLNLLYNRFPTMANKTIESIGAKATFLKKNWQIAYAAILIILIPIAVIANVTFVTRSFSKTVDVELQRTAMMVGRMFEATSASLINDQAALSTRIAAIGKSVPEIQALDVLARDGDDFKVVASLDSTTVGNTATSRQAVLAWYDNQAIAYLTRSGRGAGLDQQTTIEDVRADNRFWSVMIPISNDAGEKTALLSVKLSLSVIDSLVGSNLFWSYLWLVITVLIIVLVLLSNTRLFQYASLYRKIREVDAMKDEFISMASHELRAPITAIRGYLSLFLDNAFGKLEDKGREVMQTTFGISTHLATLVEDLLDVSRIEQGRIDMDIKEIEVEPIITEILAQMKFEAEKKSLTLSHKNTDAVLPKIKADESRLKQVVINLVSNAIKYTPAGSVVVTTEPKENGMMEIRVIDTGLGMSSEARERLFTKFYRVKTDDTSMIPGTGLGLWITKRIVELMKGRIFCDSIEKVGTQMSVLIPIAADTTNMKKPTTQTDAT